MASLQEIRQTIIDWIEDDSDTDLIDRTINSQLRFMCKREFEALYRTIDRTPDNDGVIIEPPACDGVLGIYSKTASGKSPDFSFMGKTVRQPSGEPRTNRYLYRPTVAKESDETLRSGLSTTAGDKLITSVISAFDDDDLGSEVRIENDPTRYIVTNVYNANTIHVYPTVRDTIFNTAVITMNPAGMKQYILETPQGEAYTDDVTIDYQVVHPPLREDNDMLLIPMERTLSLMVVQQFLHQSKYDVDAERLKLEIMEARIAEYATESTNRQDNAPKDAMFSFRSKRGMRGRGR